MAERVGAGQRGACGKSFDDHALALGADVDCARAKIRAQDIAKARELAGRAGQGRSPGDRAAFLASERKGDVGPRHREPPDDFADRFGLGAVGLEKFQARGGRIKEVGDLDARALRQRCRRHFRFHAAFDRQRPCMRFAGVAGRDGELGHRADRGQGLAAESQRANAQQVFIVELGSRVTFDRQREIRAGHAATIVGDGDFSPAAAVGEDLDPARTGVDGVFDQLLDDARRTLHHLARGDAVDDLFGQLSDGHSGSLAKTAG